MTPVNLDYNEICNLIKTNTIGRIPVSNPNSKTEFDDELFSVLLDQLERVSVWQTPLVYLLINCPVD